MRLASSFRNVSLGLATVAIALAGAAWAQPPASSTQQQAQSWNLVGVNARLDQTLSANKANSGERVEARLNGSVRTASGMKLPRGTELQGRVENVHASINGGPSSLTVVFTTAELKGGRRIPVKVTVLGAYPSDEANLAVTGTETMPPVPTRINNEQRIDQEAGMLQHVSLHSAVQSADSGTFRDNKGNLKLKVGTFLQIGIAPANGSSRG